MISKATLAAVLCAATLSACSSNAPPAKPKPNALSFPVVADSIVNVGLRDVQWGVEVWDQSRNLPLYSHDANRHFIPASNTKLIVTTTVMDLLGPDWRYATPVSVIGAPGDSAPTGLIIKGSGDPSMSGRFFGDDFAVMDSMADSLAAHGVRRINGDIIVDATIFTPEHIHGSWEIGDLPWYYAAPTAAFGIGEAAVRMIVSANDVQFVGTAPGMPIARKLRVDSANARSNVDVDYLAWPDSLVVVGSIASNRADSSWIAQPDPEDYAARSLIAALQKKNIRVTGNVRVVRDSAGAAAIPTGTTVFVWRSPPMKDIVAGLLRPSQNWIAEQLLKTLGATKGKSGSWRGGLEVERRYLIDVAHIDSTSFSLSDGSGLSAHNVVAPHAFVMLLEHARRSPWGAIYKAALPAPGMKGGTLSNRLAGLETRVSAKTGSIANVASLSGYVRTADGRDLTFSILTNGAGRPSAEVRRGIDALVQALAREKNWEQ